MCHHHYDEFLCCISPTSDIPNESGECPPLDCGSLPLRRTNPTGSSIRKGLFNNSATELKSEVRRLCFGNPIGLAAGWDKSGRALRMLDHLGFGFAEIGSISARLSHGNPKPRLFRLPNDRTIVVNYGLPKVTCPVFLKVAPNLDPAALERLLVEAEPFDFVRGFIFNLPMGKPPALSLTTPPSIWNTMPGAVAGQPVEQLINTCIRELYARMPRERFVIIEAGGVFNAEDAYQKIRLGASLVQVYSALIYEGPGVVKQINRGLSALLRRDGFKHVSQAVGTGISRHDSKPSPALVHRDSRLRWPM